MAEKPIDLRVRLTQKALKDALIEAMETQHISGITVRLLCDKAGINHSTFNTNYSNRKVLLNYIEQDVMDNLKRYLESDVNWRAEIPSTMTLLPILEYAKKNVNLLSVLLSENCDVEFQNRIMDLVIVVIFRQEANFDTKTWSDISTFCISGGLSILKKWLREGAVESPESVSEFIHKIIFYGILSFS